MPASPRDRLLILGGTGEGLALARSLAETMPELSVTTSLAGRTRDPVLPPGGTRSGGFGGIDGLVDYVRDQQISVLVNATHPFAAEMSAHAEAAQRRLGLPLLRLLRPAWQEQPDEHWIKVPDIAAAAFICRRRGKRVFLSVGARDLAAFADMPGTHFIVRLVDRPTAPLSLTSCDLITARGPFALADERRLLHERGIDLLITKNSGGDATYPKIEAARALAVPVVMIDRPEIARHPGSETVDSVAAAVEWVAARLGSQIARSRRTGESNATTGDKA
jgi:precorrin-6A/cobalt-precorrin-6A reductase